MDLGLQKLVGHRVIVMGPSYIDTEKLVSVKLLAVEAAGIWIESQEAVDKILADLTKKPSVTNLVIFIPFAQITTIVAGFEPE